MDLPRTIGTLRNDQTPLEIHTFDVVTSQRLSSAAIQLWMNDHFAPLSNHEWENNAATTVANNKVSELALHFEQIRAYLNSH